jgi:hypothetical protein
MIVSGTCGACCHYRDGQCQRAGSRFVSRSVWTLACVDCDGYARSTTPATPVSPDALAAVRRSS